MFPLGSELLAFHFPLTKVVDKRINWRRSDVVQQLDGITVCVDHTVALQDVSTVHKVDVWAWTCQIMFTWNHSWPTSHTGVYSPQFPDTLTRWFHIHVTRERNIKLNLNMKKCLFLIYLRFNRIIRSEHLVRRSSFQFVSRINECFTSRVIKFYSTELSSTGCSGLQAGSGGDSRPTNLFLKVSVFSSQCFSSWLSFKHLLSFPVSSCSLSAAFPVKLFHNKGFKMTGAFYCEGVTGNETCL